MRCLQDSCNALLQLYLMHLIDAGQHALLPVYACHMRADVRHEVRARLTWRLWEFPLSAHVLILPIFPPAECRNLPEEFLKGMARTAALCVWGPQPSLHGTRPAPC